MSLSPTLVCYRTEDAIGHSIIKPNEMISLFCRSEVPSSVISKEAIWYLHVIEAIVELAHKAPPELARMLN